MLSARHIVQANSILTILLCHVFALKIGKFHLKLSCFLFYFMDRQRMVKCKTQTKITSVGKDVEKLEPLCTIGGKVKWCSHYGKQYGGSSENLK